MSTITLSEYRAQPVEVLCADGVPVFMLTFGMAFDIVTAGRLRLGIDAPGTVHTVKLMPRGEAIETLNALAYSA